MEHEIVHQGTTHRITVGNVYMYKVHALKQGGTWTGPKANLPGPPPDAQMTLAGKSFSDSEHGLEHPDADPCIWFSISAGSKSLLGQASHKEYVWYKDKFWRRATNAEAGFRARGSLKRIVGGRLNTWLYEEQILNQPEVSHQLMAIIGKRLKDERG